MSKGKTGCRIMILASVILLLGLWELLIPGYLLDPKGASHKADNLGTLLTLIGAGGLVAGFMWWRRRT